MKIGITESPYRRFGDGRFDLIRSHGYETIDYNLAETTEEIYTVSESEFEATLLHAKDMAAKAGLEISQVHGPWRWPPKDNTPEDRAERLEKMLKSIRGTALLGCKHWVVHPIMPFHIFDKGTENEQLTWEMNREFMPKLLAAAKEYDVTICLENMPMPKFAIGSPSEILQLVKEMNDKHFKVCFDTGHAVICRSDMQPHDAIRAMGDQIRVLHVHDNKGGEDSHMHPMFGIIDWPALAQALRDIHYAGSFSLEASLPTKLNDALLLETSQTLCRLAHQIID